MALCLSRSFSSNSQLHLSSLLSRCKPNFTSPNYPHKLSKSTNLPLVHHQNRICSSSYSMDAPPEGYRRNVGICLINSSKKIFAASRLDIPDSWQMPQVPYWLTYDFPPEVREKLKHQWGGDWKGQAQKWFLLKFTGKEEEINLLGDKSEKPEFGEWKWMSPEQILERAVDFKKPVYKEVFTVFTPHLQ